MHRAVSLLSLVAILVGFRGMDGGVAAADNPLPRLPRDKLLVYRGPEGKFNPSLSRLQLQEPWKNRWF